MSAKVFTRNKSLSVMNTIGSLNMQGTTPFVLYASSGRFIPFISQGTGRLRGLKFHINSATTADNTIEVGVYGFDKKIIGKKKRFFTNW